MSALPSQTRGLIEKAGLTRAEVNRAAWAIDRAGRRYTGAAAVNRTLAELGGWRHLARLYRLPVIRQLEDLGYRVFAANRGRFARWGAVPGCQRSGADCLTARGEAVGAPE